MTVRRRIGLIVPAANGTYEPDSRWSFRRTHQECGSVIGAVQVDGNDESVAA